MTDLPVPCAHVIPRELHRRRATWMTSGVLLLLTLVPGLARGQYPTYVPPRPGPVDDSTFWRISPKLAVGAIVPWGEGYAGSPGGGLALDASIWAELPFRLAVELRIGLRFDLVRSDDSYAEVPMDVGVFYLVGRGPVALVLGGGAGGRRHWETRSSTIRVGEILAATTEEVLDDGGWGAGIYGRVGLLLRGDRRSRGSLMLSSEVSTTFIRLNDSENPTSVVFLASATY